MVPPADDEFSTAEELKARNDIRQSALQGLAAVGLVGGLLFTARTYRLSRQSHDLARREQFTSRYGAAIDHLASDKLVIRVGGIYALKRLIAESEDDAATVIEVLAAFCRATKPPKDSVVTQDVQVAMDVIVGTPLRLRPRTLNLQYADLLGVRLTSANLIGADLTGAGLELAMLADADLRWAKLDRTRLEKAWLRGVDFRGIEGEPLFGDDARLRGALLCGFDPIGGIKLVGADLIGSDLRAADLMLSDLRGAALRGADLRDTSLYWCDLRGADFEDANMTGCNLTRAHMTRGALSDAQREVVNGLENIRWHEPDDDTELDRSSELEEPTS
jgi:uncharacterized protein YjbI with pentapeptide repeats